MSLREVLDALVTSEPFERLLLERARPIVARADAGQDFLLAGLAVALDAPLMVVRPGPREAEELASEIGAYLGPERRRPPPGMGRASLRGDGPGARGRGPKGRRPRAPPLGTTARSSSWPPTSRRCRRCLRPWGRWRRCSSRRAWSWRRTRSRNGSRSWATSGSTWSSTEGSSRSAEASSTSSPASPGDRPGSSTGATRSSGSASSRPRPSSRPSRWAGSRSRRCESSCPTTSSARSPRDGPRTCPTGSATACNGSPTGCVSKDPTRSRRSSSSTCRRRGSSSRPVPGSW